MARPPIYQATLEKIQGMSKRVASGAKIGPPEDEEYLRIFEDYECWSPFFKMLAQKIKSKTSNLKDTYVRLAKVQSLYLEDVFAAAETCAKMVKNLDISFAQFLQEIIPEIIEKDDFTTEAAILQAASTEFSGKKDHIACLERLCMLYEKKTYNEAQLATSYEKLLDLDRHNIKALRYFKLVYTQNQDWENVAALLQNLIKSVKHKQERYRVAQELAMVLLYHLDQPEDTIRVLRAYCADSPLDTSNIEFEACQRMKDFQGCYDVLQSRLKREPDASNQAILHFKIGDLCTQLERLPDAMESYERSALLWGDFLDPIEKIVLLAAKSRDWPKVIKWIEELKKRVKSPENRQRLGEAISRVNSGIGHAT